MGRRGPAPKPVELRVLEGNPGRRKMPAQAAKAAPGSAAAPSLLDAHGQRIWNEVAAALLELGLYTVLDRPALTMLCEAWARWRIAVDRVREDGPVNRHDQASGWLVVLRQAEERLLRLMQEFGMTPASRARLAVDGAAAEDPLSAWLRVRASRRAGAAKTKAKAKAKAKVKAPKTKESRR